MYSLVPFISHSGKGRTAGRNLTVVAGAEVEGEDWLERLKVSFSEDGNILHLGCDGSYLTIYVFQNSVYEPRKHLMKGLLKYMTELIEF